MSRSREEMLADLKISPKVEAIVIGGGINGISTFRELALQGVRVLLVDRGDFCGACSSAPSRMIHGGLRYLENGELALVRESLSERDALLRNAPHFVRPLPTTVPIHHVFSGLLNSAFNVLRLRSEPAERGALAVKIGLTLYDLLVGKHRILPRHTFRGRAKTAALWPDLPEEVRYTATYHDAWISHPERLGIELLQDGLAATPEAAALNHVAVVGREGTGVRLRDALTGDEFAVETDLIINATGAWLDETNAAMSSSDRKPAPMVGGTKGSHLILDHPELVRALNGHMIYFENVDGRVCIVFPYLGRVLLGSTDIRVESPGDVRCEDHEVDYILKSLSYVFPGIAVKPEHIVYRYSGVRPLPRSDASFTGSISRDHLIEELPGAPPVLCLVGGKWTTFRAFGEQTADKALALLGKTRRVDTAERRIGGGANFPDTEAGVWALADSLVREFGVTPERARHAIDHYGTDAQTMFDFCRGTADAAIDDTEYTEAELRYLVHSEFARSLADLLQRRTSLAISGALSSTAIAQATRILTEELGWSSDESTRQEASFRQRLADDHGLTSTILTARDRNTGSLECA
jgi:glycerol-3-phosphate dehydrogenase